MCLKALILNLKKIWLEIVINQILIIKISATKPESRLKFKYSLTFNFENANSPPIPTEMLMVAGKKNTYILIKLLNTSTAADL